MLDAIFDFDQDVLRSKAYRLAARSNMKQALLTGRNDLRKGGGLTTGAVGSVYDNMPPHEDGQTLKGEHENSWLILDTLQTQTRVVPAVAGLGYYPSQHNATQELTDSHKLVDWSTSVSFKTRLITSPPPTVSHTSTGRLVGSAADARRRVYPRSFTFPKWMRSSTSSPYASQRPQLRPAELSKIEETPENGNRDTITSPKVLILGSSDAGKSTLLKSMRLFCGGSHSDLESKLYKEIIFSNLVVNMRAILEEMKSQEISLETDANKYHAETIFRQPYCMEVDSLPPRVTSAIAALWKDSCVQRCFRRSNKYQLDDNCQ